MARITVEDCRPYIANSFELTILAAERARQLNEGAPPAIDNTGHKSAVAALREIAAGARKARALRLAAVKRRQQIAAADEFAEETPEPPPGDAFERQSEETIAARLEPLPVAGTARDAPYDEGEAAEAEARDRAA